MLPTKSSSRADRVKSISIIQNKSNKKLNLSRLLKVLLYKSNKLSNNNLNLRGSFA